MPRPVGVRNRDFEEKRAALVDTLTDFALTMERRNPSLRQFAIAASASEPTLRHYFGDRRGVILAILENLNKRAQPIWNAVRTPAKDPETAIEEYFRITRVGMMHGGFAEGHAFGIVEGIADEVIGEAYLEYILNPALEVVSQKLGDTPGADMSGKDGMAAAFLVLAPMLVMTLHQHLLGGDDKYPIDAERFLSTVNHLIVTGMNDKAAKPGA
ncbi:MAG: hypothetical protein AAGA24_06975 [Pseudomonadota bacterium]